MNYRLLLRIGRKKTNFYGPIFLLPVEDKISFKTQKIGPEPAKPTISLALPVSVAHYEKGGKYLSDLPWICIYTCSQKQNFTSGSSVGISRESTMWRSF